MKPTKQRALTVIQRLIDAGHQAALAGGCVRDELMNRKPMDYDVATTATPEQVQNIFAKGSRKFKVVPTGIDHGTVTIVTDAGPIEVTTLRRDVETDGRHAVVSFADAGFEEDARRRDFTINAMFELPTGEILDFVGGQADLKDQILRFVGDARKRIREDYLRILRLYRFWSRLGFQPDVDATLAVQELHAGLERISQERITSELLQILSGEHLEPALTSMVHDGVFRTILPTLNDKKVLANIGHLRAISGGAFDVLGRLGFLLAACLEPTESLQATLTHLRLSKLYERSLLTINSHDYRSTSPKSQPADLMRVIDRCEMSTGKGSFLSLYAPVWQSLAKASHSDEDYAKILALITCEEHLGTRRTANLSLCGPDVMRALNIGPGPKVGEMLEQLKVSFRNNEWQSPEQGIAYLLTKTKIP